MVKELSSHEDFATEPSLVEKIANDAGHFATFVPKFHCECNAIKQLWAEAKRKTKTMQLLHHRASISCQSSTRRRPNQSDR